MDFWKTTEEGDGQQLEEIFLVVTQYAETHPRTKEGSLCKKIGNVAQLRWNNAKEIDCFTISKINRDWVINMGNKEMANARTPTPRKMIKNIIKIKLKPI